MDRAEIDMDVPPSAVWATLAEAELFKEWVVGCKDIRHVEGDWPAPGSAIHHRVGVMLATLDDVTTVVESEEERRLVLRARARPVGVAGVHITLRDNDVGGTHVTLEEEAITGPVSHLPHLLTDRMLHPRNVEMLRRLKRIAEERDV